MVFSPDRVSLSGQRIVEGFNVWRDNKKCWHSGVDISSSGTPLSYSAGIWGEVIGAGGGIYNAITIRPVYDRVLCAISP
jgi:hypothetical protein